MSGELGADLHLVGWLGRVPVFSVPEVFWCPRSGILGLGLEQSINGTITGIILRIGILCIGVLKSI